MPAAYIHENIAQSVLKKLDKVPHYIEGNICAYELGAQGPDFLFFYHIIRFWEKDFSVNEFGETMHKKNVGEYFRALLETSAQKGDAAKAWAAGFVTHYAADTAVHPFVYASTNNDDGSENTTAHLLLETSIDTWYHREILNKKGIPRQCSSAKELSSEQKAEISETAAEACAKAYTDCPLTAKKAYDAINDINTVISILHSPFNIKYAIFRLIEKIIGKRDIIIRHAPAHYLPDTDFLNLLHTEWLNPWDKNIKSNASIVRLLKSSVEKSEIYFNAVNDYFKGEISLDDACVILGNNSYASGLPLE